MANPPNAIFVGAPSAERSADAGADTRSRVAFWDLVAQLPLEARDLAAAEVGLVKAQVVHKATEAATGIGFMLGALFIATSAITALLVGLILTLATLWGPGWATLAVVVGALAIAGLLAWLGLKHFSGKASVDKTL